MRKFVLLVASFVAFVGMVVAPSTAQALTATVQFGNTLYSVTVTAPPPTGTVSARFGTIAARCGQTTTQGSYGTPSCTTYTITCPATSSQCDVTAQGAQQTISGRADWTGYLTFGHYSGAPYTDFIDQSPYTCTAHHCAETAVFEGIQPGETVSVTVFNLDASTNPGLTGKVAITANS